ncbi:MAG TPA: DUF2520 domain-containing protein [Bryobacteraceae bacterium]|jgi:predicted short-subunit dehydrogenase-like oxidoreductase (DUF2520 family)|nr:DUF2520 domain-containing protein [Bryobacteraceae bacterium]
MALGLFGAGAVAKSFLSRVPGLPRQLGPVGAPSFRLASRIVNSMGAGYAVKSVEEFDRCRALLIAVPDKILPAVLSRLQEARINWGGRSILLCDSGEDSRVLAPFRKAGAAGASIHPLDGQASRFVVEGDAPAVREAKHLVRELKGQALELNSEKMPLYLAGQSLGSGLFLPLAAACMECIAAATDSVPTAMRITEALYQQSLRAFMHAGKKGWSGSLASGDQPAVLRELDALGEADPALARLYRELAVFALVWSHRHPALLQKLRDYPLREADAAD